MAWRTRFADLCVGFIHQAVGCGDDPSLHITVSTGMCNTWHDYLSLALPQALALASQEDRYVVVSSDDRT